jgi:hypothetical protein
MFTSKAHCLVGLFVVACKKSRRPAQAQFGNKSARQE